MYDIGAKCIIILLIVVVPIVVVVITMCLPRWIREGYEKENKSKDCST